MTPIGKGAGLQKTAPFFIFQQQRYRELEYQTKRNPCLN